MTTEILKKLYRTATGSEADSVMEISGSGSNRHYYRLAGTRTMIGVCGTSVEENEAFVYMAEHFRRVGLPVPEVYACSDDRGCYLQEDLGHVSLFDAIGQGRATGQFSEWEVELLRRTIRLLPRFQHEGARDFDYSRCFPQPAFDRRSVLWDLNYFKYCFLKTTGIEFREDRLEDDFEAMTDLLTGVPSDAFMYRDFQSRNVMLQRNGEPWFIDFQGGRRGPIYYDVASFVWQAKAGYSETLRRELLHEYMDALRAYRPVDEALFLAELRPFVLFRTLQVLGAYGFRGYFEKKEHFIESVPFAMANLRKLLEEDFPQFPYLCELLRRMSTLERFLPSKEVEKPSTLTVEVKSFAYKKGMPVDLSGNGGGFVFDCRAIHNPGKYECYQSLTGCDEPVIQFLEKDGEILRFLRHAYALVDAAVERYLKRGFTHLSVSFGCTGGQHRSVYAAQHLAERLSRKYGVRVELEHREQQQETVFEEKKSRNA
ncbi:MAG: phosphotransferase [Mediterranea sp.]|jgi:aminoglycoside/choline kinase family phosphotransferase|nr:phosphotransferase [Mediterranea sp.]